MLKFKRPTEKDYSEIKTLVKLAFEKSPYGYNDENVIIENARMFNIEYFSELVVTSDEKIVGYGLLSPAYVGKTTGLVLAPLAVTPSFQNQGIGKKIIAELEKQGAKDGFPFIHILGDPDYYGNLGYLPANTYNISAPFKVEDKYFLIKEMNQNQLNNVSGILRYSSIFT